MGRKEQCVRHRIRDEYSSSIREHYTRRAAFSDDPPPDPSRDCGRDRTVRSRPHCGRGRWGVFGEFIGGGSGGMGARRPHVSKDNVLAQKVMSMELPQRVREPRQPPSMYGEFGENPKITTIGPRRTNRSRPQSGTAPVWSRTAKLRSTAVEMLRGWCATTA